MSKQSDEYREMLNDVCSEYCDKDHYCILKEFLVSAHPSKRLLFQLKAVDKFKYEKSKEFDKDIGWTKAMELWIEEGWAEKFGNIYDESLNFTALWKKLKNGHEKYRRNSKSD